MRIVIVVALVAALLAVSALGCAHEAKTITTTETIECEDGRDPFFEDDGAEVDEAEEGACREVHRQTTVVTEERGHGCHGAVSCTFSLVGNLVSLPFRILGEVLDTVF